MVAWTPKYNLPVEEPADPSDMPAVTARQAASITAALDQVDAAAAARSAGRVSKSGDTINGGLTVTGRMAAGYDLMTGNYSWIHEFGKLWLIRWSPNKLEVSSKPIWVDYPSGDVGVDAALWLAGIPESLGGTDLSEATRSLMRLSNGKVVSWSRVVHGLWANLNPSTARIKDHIRPAGDLSGLLAVEPVEFCYRPEILDDGGKVHLGVLAEQVAEVFPAAAVNDSDGQPEGVNTMALVAGLIATVRDQQARIEALETRLAALPED